MVILFIGILLLLVGYFYFGYNKEGFQTPSATVNTCVSGTTQEKCNPKCIRDPLRTPTSDEEQAYNIYESQNLADTKLTAPPVIVPTSLKQYNSAGALTPFDIDKDVPIPWDFDNKDSNPAITMFGSVSAEASQAIFSKCESQALYDDINNLDFDPNSGLFSYRSQLFGVTLYDQRQAAALQFGEMFIGNELGNLMGEVYEKVKAMPNEIAHSIGSRVNSSVSKNKEAQFKLEQQISDYKAALIANRGDKLAAIDTVKANTNNGLYDTRWHEESGKTSAFPMSKLDKAKGVDTVKRGRWKFGRESIVKSPLYIDFEDPEAAGRKLQQMVDDNIAEDIKAQRDRLNGKGEKFSGKLQYLQNARTLISRNNQSSKLKIKSSELKTTGIADLNGYGPSVIKKASLRASLAISAKIAKKAISAAAVKLAFTIVTGIIAGIKVVALAFGAVPISTACGVLLGMAGVIGLLMTAVEIACTTFVPAIFNAFLDYDAVCPLNRDGKSPMFNINDYLEARGNGSKFPGGEIGGTILLNVLQNAPPFGPMFMALGPYLCFSDVPKDYIDGVGIMLKNNLKSPPYYYDATLSIYNAGKKPRFQAGKTQLDQRLFNPLTFHYNNDINNPTDAGGRAGYPVWVDFANPIMLNKMAQFYYDAARKCYITNDDGTLSFQYISKFYGLISTTELTCDVQCEITEVKFNPETGQKICEFVVPIEPGTLGTLHHDRRFYFFKDMGRAIVNRSKVIDESNTAALQALMEDNLNIYIVTGCTNTDGTAPDCITFNSEGDSVSNSVVSLGNPGGTYQTPIVNIEDANNIPKDSTCGRQVKFTRYNGISHPAATNNPSTNNRDAQIVTGPVDNWIYAYKDQYQNYYYPCGNITNSSNTPSTLKTAKYWSIIWNQKCNYEDVNCQINSKQGVGTIVQGTTEGLIGMGFGIGYIHGAMKPGSTSNTFNAVNAGAPIGGGVIQTAMAIQFPGQEMSISQQLSCTYEELSNQPGTYIMNGRLMTSQQGFIVDQGPFVNWAPGYTPTIQYCSKQSIEIFDCVNSYAVRRFVDLYHKNNSTQAIKKINNITPTLDTGAKWDVKNSQAMCIYSIETVQYDPVNFKELPNTASTINVGVNLTQNVDDKTCTFIPPGTLSYDNKIYPPQIFTINADEPVWPTTSNQRTELLDIGGITNIAHKVRGTGLSTALDRGIAAGVGAIANALNIPANTPAITMTQIFSALSTIRSNSGSAVEAIAGAMGVTATNLPPTLLPEFETIVLSPANNVNCSNSTIQRALINSFNDAHDGAPTLISVSESLSMSTIGGQNLCLFKGNFGSVYNPETLSTMNKENSADPTKVIKRNLTIILDKKGKYERDDYPIKFTYTPIPKRSTWFDVPPRMPEQASSTSFARPGCSNDSIYNDCSNSALIDILITKYNTNSTNSKILKVWRSFTPSLSSSSTSRQCDYDVERLNTMANGKTILNRETVRFTLEPDNNGECIYKLNESATAINLASINSGVSLNLSDSLGMLKSPYITAVTYSKNVQSQFITAIQNYLGYDIGGTINITTTNTLNKMQDVRRLLYTNNTLYKCQSKSCMDDTVIKAMINRYNFDAYPSYPPKMNTVSKNSIIRVTKVGTSTPLACQLELYLRNDFFTDFLYNPLPEDTQFYLRNYEFNLIDTSVPCTFKVKPFSKDDILKSTMDISGDAFSLECPPAPSACPATITRSSAASFTWVTTDYTEIMIQCNILKTDDSVMKLIENIYNSTVIFTKAGTNYYNTINKFKSVFNATPNILEFKVTTQRVYWDDDYNIPYYTGLPNDADNIEESYLIVTWPEGTSYEVETGYFWLDSTGAFVATPTSAVSIINGSARSGSLRMGTPTIQEFFYPDLTFTAKGVFKKNPDGSTTQVYLPYISNFGLIDADSRQTAKFMCNPVNCSD